MKRAEIKKRPMSDTVLAALEPEAKEYREPFGIDRLSFVVAPNGRKRWEMRYKRPNGTWSWLGLGGYPDVGIKRARALAAEKQALIADGIDPKEHAANQKAAATAAAANTFRAAAEDWYRQKERDGKAAGTLRQMRLYLDGDMLPALGDKPLTTITRTDCRKLQEVIEARGAHDAAKKVRGWLRHIFSRAIALELCDNNPASELAAVAEVAPASQNFPFLRETELPAFLRALRLSRASLATRTAAWLTIWTASRPGMVRFAEWSEIDFETATWSIPAEKMKMRAPHITPLPRQALDALRELQRVTGRSRWLFPGTGSKCPVISDATINKEFGAIGFKGRMTGHGSRHTASTLLREHRWHKDFTEAQLAHKEPGMAGVYNAAAYLEYRRDMIQWYADYLDALEAGITPGQRAEFDSRVIAADPAALALVPIVRA